MKKRKKVTPQWLSLLRKIHTYLGGSTILTATLTRFGMSNADIILLIGWWMAVGMFIQFFCDITYQKEPESKFPTEASKISD